MNKRPRFMSDNLQIKSTSHYYYLIKLLLFILCLSNPWEQIQMEDLDFIIKELDQEGILIKEFLGLEKKFFDLFCQIEIGDFFGFLAFLGSEDPKYLIFSSMVIWWNLPFIAYIFTDNKYKENRKLYSNILMLGLFEIMKVFFEMFKIDSKLFDEEDIIKKLNESVQNNIQLIFKNYIKNLKSNPSDSVNWFTIEISTIFDTIMCDFTDFLIENFFLDKKSGIINKKNKSAKYKELNNKYVKDLMDRWKSLYEKLKKMLFENKSFENIIKFFPILFFGTSN